jgi:hypothetical protein
LRLPPCIWAVLSSLVNTGFQYPVITANGVLVLAPLLQYILSGATLGATYGLAGLGFTVIFNTTGIITSPRASS